MKALLQRVSQASVSVDGKIIGRIGPGLVVLVGIEAEDTEADARYPKSTAYTFGVNLFSFTHWVKEMPI